VQPEPTVAVPRPARQGHGLLRDVLEVLLIAVVLYLAIWSALQTVRVDGESMVGTLQNNDLLLASKISYYFGNPQRGDIVVLNPPSDPSKDFIKRVIGVPGDRIEVDGNQSPTALLVEPGGRAPWQRVQEPYLPERWDTMNFCCLPDGMQSSTAQPITIPAAEYFVMGDNRNKSSDSRSFGLVPRKSILAKAFVRVLPLGHFGFGPGPTLEPAPAATAVAPPAAALVLALPPSLLLQRRRNRLSRPEPGSVVRDGPGGGAALPVEQLVGGEEALHLAGGALRRVAAVDDVHGQAHREVTPDRARGRGGRVGGAHHGAHQRHRTRALPHHGEERRGGDELDQAGEEGPLTVLGVVTLGGLRGEPHQLGPHRVQTAPLEAGDDLTDESALDPVRLDEHEGAFSGHASSLSRG